MINNTKTKIAELHKTALKKQCQKTDISNCDLRIKLSGPSAKHKAVNIYLYNPDMLTFSRAYVMPSGNRLYIEPTQNYNDCTFAITIKPHSKSGVIKIGAAYYDKLCRYAGRHNTILYISGDTSIYYVEANNDND